MGSFVYDTNALIQTVPNLKTAQTFLLDRFFRTSSRLIRRKSRSMWTLVCVAWRRSYRRSFKETC